MCLMAFFATMIGPTFAYPLRTDFVDLYPCFRWMGWTGSSHLDYLFEGLSVEGTGYQRILVEDRIFLPYLEV